MKRVPFIYYPPMRWMVAVCGIVLIAHALPATAADGGLSWHGTLKEGYAQALKEHKPILMILGADWSGPCKELDQELATPEVTRTLLRWVRVRLDVDHTDGAATLLQNGTIPLLRILSPTGRRVDFKEGAVKSADLVKWLDGAYDGALMASGEQLLGADASDASSLAKLIEHLSDPDAASREAAIKRLAPSCPAAAGAVAQTFAKGNLLTRLACLALLNEWKAPVAGIDPWQPDTVTPEKLKAIAEWAAKQKGQAAVPATAPAVLTSEQLEDARREISHMVAASTQDEARATRERLARLGRQILPLIQDALKSGPVDAARERLLALRYRLAATDAIVAGWPGGIERLASTDAKTRPDHRRAHGGGGIAVYHDQQLAPRWATQDSPRRELFRTGRQGRGRQGRSRAMGSRLSRG